MAKKTAFPSVFKLLWKSRATEFHRGVFSATVSENAHRTIRNPTMYTVGQAAKATGKAKSTISKAISGGLISATKNGDGSYSIDPAELHRVFPAVGSANSPEKHELDDLEPFDLRFENGRLQGELKQLRERMAELGTLQDRERQQLTDQIEDLRRRLDTEAEERRKMTAMLTDQRQPERRGWRFWQRRAG